MQKILRNFMCMDKDSWQLLRSPLRWLVVPFILWALIWVTNQPSSISLVTRSDSGGTARPITIKLPHNANSTHQSRSIVYSVSIDHKRSSPVKWRIIADDCIRRVEINGEPVDMSAAKGNPCSYRWGVVFDLSAHLQDGMNSLEVTAEDLGGLYGFNMLPIPTLPHPFPLLEDANPLLLSLVGAAAAGVFIMYACRFLRRRQVDYASIGLVIVSAIISLHYLYISTNDVETNDLSWHINYTMYVAQNWLTPYNYTVSTGSHPPLYYYFAAVTLRVDEMLIGLPNGTALRFLSWVFFLVFNSFNLLTLRRTGLTGAGYYASAALLLLWPGNAHLASKINSEIMYYAVAAMSFYYIIAWYQEGRQRDLMVALIVTGVALMVRTNAVIIFSLIGLLMLVTMFRGRLPLRNFFTVEWVKTGAIVLLCLLVGFGGIFIHHDAPNNFMPAKSTFFPLMHFLSPRYALDTAFNTWNHGFVEYFLKTSMFGEYGWDAPRLAIAMNYFVFAIFWYSMLPWLFATRTQLRGMLPYMLYLLLSGLFVADFYTRIGQHASAQDVRYIYPALICLVVLFGRAHAIYTQRGALVLSCLGPLLAVGFTMLSTYFFWTNFR